MLFCLTYRCMIDNYHCPRSPQENTEMNSIPHRCSQRLCGCHNIRHEWPSVPTAACIGRHRNASANMCQLMNQNENVIHSLNHPNIEYKLIAWSMVDRHKYCFNLQQFVQCAMVHNAHIQRTNKQRIHIFGMTKSYFFLRHTVEINKTENRSPFIRFRQTD